MGAPGSGDLYQSGPSSSNQFIRRWQLVFIGSGGSQWVTSDSNASGAVSGGTSTVDDALRVTFKTRQTMLETQGLLEARVWNIARARTIQQLRNLYNRVVLRAGYQTGNFGVIFDGQIIDWEQGRDDNLVDTFIGVRAQDGFAAYNVATSQVNIARGTKITDAVKQAAQPLVDAGASLAKVLLPNATDTLIRAVVHSGMAVEGIKKFGLNPMIQNSQLNIAPIQQTFGNGGATILSSTTGLIGPARLTGNSGLIFTCNLNSALQVHDVVKVDQTDINTASGSSAAGASAGQTTSQGPGLGQFGYYVDPSADGTYECLVIEHEGDTRGNVWQTHGRAWPVGTPLTTSAQQTFQGYGVGPTAGQESIYKNPPNLPDDGSGYYQNTGGAVI